ncbi:MAG: hypothetical protein KF872_04260 [Chitinophagales bacterium]|nr:hypothetical protein [Chitinophagales bacterium]
MKHNYVFIVLLLVSFLWGNNALAQGYSAWSEIYNRNGTKVSISFRTSTNSCDPSGKTNKYRFNIEGALQSGKKELLVTIKYQNCSKADSKEQKYIDIGTQGGAVGINESIDYTLTGDISERTVKAEEKQTYVPPPPTTTYSQPSNSSSGSSSSYSSSSSSSSKKYKKFLGMRFGLNVGFDIGSRPMVVNFTTTSTQTIGSGSNTFLGSGQKLVNPFGMGFRGDIMFHPLYRSNIHLGVIVGGAYGGSVAMINGGTWKTSNDAGSFEDKINYKYSKFDFGIDFAIGWTSFKYLIKYMNSLQMHDFNYTRTSNYTGSDLHKRVESIQDFGVYQTRRDVITMGFRINGKRGARMGRSKRSAPAVVDLYWNISRDNPWNWSSGDILAQSKDWQLYGFGLAINIGRIIYISGDMGLNTVASSKLPTEVITPAKTKNFYSQITLAYNFTHSF